MNYLTKIYGELLATMEVNIKTILIDIIVRLFFCCIFWSVWVQEGIYVIVTVVLITLPVLLFPLIHLRDSVFLYEKGIFQKGKFFTWEQVGSVQFTIIKSSPYNWIKQVQMRSECKVFNVSYLINPIDTYRGPLKSEIEQGQIQATHEIIETRNI